MTRKKYRPSKGVVGSAIDPTEFLSLIPMETTTDIRNWRWFGISYMPYATQREFAAWCAEHVWRLLFQPSPADIKMLQKALEACREDAASPLGTGLLMGHYDRIIRRAGRIDVQSQRAGEGGWLMPWAPSIDAMESVAYACSESAFFAACEAFSEAFEAIRKTEARINRGNDWEPIYALVTGMRNHLATAHAQALERAREMNWPEITGTDVWHPQAVLLREGARQRLVRVIEAEQLDPDEFDRIQLALTQLSETTEALSFIAAARPAQNNYNWNRHDDWTLSDEAIKARNDDDFPGEYFWEMPMSTVGGVRRKSAKKAAQPVVGAAFDPACAFFPYGDAWTDSAFWVQALDLRNARLLACDVAERFALPLFRTERPGATAVIAAIQEAIATGREMAESLTGSENTKNTNALLDELDMSSEYEEEYARTLNGGSHWHGAALHCLRVVRRCIAPTAILSTVGFFMREAFSCYVARTVNTMITSAEHRQALATLMEPVDETARECLRRAFHEAEMFAYENGYPVLSGASHMTEEPTIVVATLLRQTMLRCMRVLWEMKPTPAIAAKLSLADEAMRSITAAGTYIYGMSGDLDQRKPSRWANSDDPNTMEAWQVILNWRRSLDFAFVIGRLRALRRMK